MLPNDQRDDSGARCPECGRLMALGQIGPQMVLALARPLVTFNDCDRTSGPPAFAPLLFYLSLDLLPVSFNAVPVHLGLPFWSSYLLNSVRSCHRHRGQSLLRVLERRQHLKPVLCPARQHNLVVGEFEAVVTDNHQPGAHAQETTDRQNGVWLLAVACHQQVVNLADRLVRTVDDAATDDLRRPIAGCHLLYIDFGNLYRLWNALRICVCGEKHHANYCSARKKHCFLHDYSPWPGS